MAALPSHVLFHVSLLLCRISMGAYFLVAGIGKLRMGLPAFHEYFQTYQPAWLPDVVASPYAYAIPFLEITLGLLLIVGLFTRAAAVVALLMVISFTIAQTIKAGSLVVGGKPFNPNLIFLTLLLLLAVTAAGRFSVDHLWRGRKPLAS